jgi:rhodanese-related sulfurtransferase
MSLARVVHDVDPLTLKRWLDRDQAILIDVREPDEYAREHLAGARLMPLSGFDRTALPAADGKTVVLQCNSGNRSRQLAEQCGGEWHHLDGGIQAWKRAGLPVETERHAPLPIMRQVQIAAGSLIVLGQILAWLVAPAFALLSAFVGAGLIFAGITGTCGMARLLGRLPYNRAPGELRMTPDVPAQGAARPNRQT